MSRKSRDCVWLCVTKDKFELPVAVADSAGELAKLIGKRKNTVESLASKRKHGIMNSTIVQVYLDNYQEV